MGHLECMCSGARAATTRSWLVRAALLGLVVSPGPSARAADVTFVRSPWVELWGASPQQPVDPVLKNAAITLNDQTIREVVRVSRSGSMLRLRLTNEYTDVPTVVGAVKVAISMANGTASSGIVSGSSRVVTFGGQGSVTLAPDAPALSDPIDLPVEGLTSLAVSIYVSQATAPTTPHSLGVQTAYIASGDQTGAATLASGSMTTLSRYLLSGIEAYEPRGAATIVTLGDSITDGYASTPDANRRWPDFLVERLQQSALRYLAVSDQGISGNRLLSEGIGPDALSRLDRDVLSRPGVRYVTLLEGINDIGFPAVFPGSTVQAAGDLIGAYRQIIARVHERGIFIFGCTLTPFKGAAYYTAAGEQTREALNAFIRNSGEFDGVIDFDKATRDPKDPTTFRPAYDSGDHLHPNDDGYAAMADAVPLALFRQ